MQRLGLENLRGVRLKCKHRGTSRSSKANKGLPWYCLTWRLKWKSDLTLEKNKSDDMETELPHREGVDGSVSYPPLPSAKRSLESPATRKEAKRSPARYLLLPCNLAAQILLPCNTWRCVERSDEKKNESDAESCRTVAARMEGAQRAYLIAWNPSSEGELENSRLVYGNTLLKSIYGKLNTIPILKILMRSLRDKYASSLVNWKSI